MSPITLPVYCINHSTVSITHHINHSPQSSPTTLLYKSLFCINQALTTSVTLPVPRQSLYQYHVSHSTTSVTHHISHSTTSVKPHHISQAPLLFCINHSSVITPLPVHQSLHHINHSPHQSLTTYIPVTKCDVMREI
jgi:hypothetical protein